METLVPKKHRELLTDIGLLIMRLWAGLIMIYAHGWGKLVNFSERADAFPDPLGIGSTASLALAAGAEVFAALLLAVGLATRIVAVPLLITMLVAAYAHAIMWGDPFGDYELALFFATAYLMFIFTGPGKFSLDHLVEQRRKSD